jgi:UDP-glucose 4-epimerase
MNGITNFQGKNVLITGGLGFIGSNLAHKLVSVGANVTLVDSLIPQYGGSLYNIREIEDQVRVNISDVRDPHSMRMLIQGKDYLFNLAGQTSHLDSMEDPETDMEINCRAQLSILESCRRYNPGIRVVFASTRQLYGRPDALPVNEKHLPRPVDVNGINKMAGEWYHILYNNVHGISSCSLRLTNTYGPRMRIRDARQTFLGVWIRLILEEKPFEIWEGQQLRDFTYVDDAVDAFLLAAVNPQAAGQIFNLGGCEVISLTDLGKLLVEVNGRGNYLVREFPKERKRIDIGDYYADDQLIRSTLGWEPRVPIREGLMRTLNYYRTCLKEYVE